MVGSCHVMLGLILLKHELMIVTLFVGIRVPVDVAAFMKMFLLEIVKTVLS